MNYRCAELGLEEMLADPIVRMVMRSDGIAEAQIRAVMKTARDKWFASHRRIGLQAAE